MFYQCLLVSLFQLYPNMTITNIVEDHELTIRDWPDSHGHKHGHTVQPFRCVGGYPYYITMYNHYRNGTDFYGGKMITY